MSHDPLTPAYLAGVIDCDGYITVQRTRKANAGRAAPNIYYCLKVGISGTRTQPHELGRDTFGGQINRYIPKNPTHRAQYQWDVTGPVAHQALIDLLPYLRVKREQALQGVEFQELIKRHRAEQRAFQKPPYRVTVEMQAEREPLWRRVTELNQSKLRSKSNIDGTTLIRVGKSAAGRFLDGRQWNEYPND